MDMQLVPKYAGDESAGANGTVRIDPRLVQNMGVRTARAERDALARSVRASGTIAFDERSVTVVQTRVAGIVDQVRTRAPLTAVRRGETLLSLIAPDWTAAEEEYLALRRAPGAGLDTLRDAARQRLLLLGLDESQIRAIERSGHAQTHFAVVAPRDGVIGELAVREGATVMAGAPLLTLNGLDTVWMNAAVAEADSGHVAGGATATASVAAFPGERFAGTVEALLPEVDAQTRTQKARIVLDNPGHRLAPGMFAGVEIASPASAAAIVVPSEAVISTGLRDVVIVAAGTGRFRAQQVRIGEEAGGRSAVLEGLREGETVVLSGQFLIDSEASLDGTLARLDGAGGAAPPASAGEATMHLASGTLERIDGRRWTIATEPIASLGMGAMSMTFVAPAAPPATPIRVGQRVSFSFARNAAGDFEIAKIAALDAPAAAQP
jgi:Cu(I)/Ag(I) efflux system membrane fusion protein